MVYLRLIWALVTASLYWLATLWLALLGFVVVPFAIWFGVARPSKLTGRPIFTAPNALSLWGNEQDGFDPEWAVATIYKGWPTFSRRYSWAAWRNKVRNLPFVSWLDFLHLPQGELHQATLTVRQFTVHVRWRRWMTELEYIRGDRFGKFGPRLEQPFSRVSWAMRPWGKL
jgi:hypothetical protein